MIFVICIAFSLATLIQTFRFLNFELGFVIFNDFSGFDPLLPLLTPKINELLELIKKQKKIKITDKFTDNKNIYQFWRGILKYNKCNKDIYKKLLTVLATPIIGNILIPP